MRSLSRAYIPTIITLLVATIGCSIRKNDAVGRIDSVMFTLPEMVDLVHAIANDRVSGRSIGSPGIDTVANLIENFFAFHKLARIEGNETYFQSFTLVNDNTGSLEVEGIVVPTDEFIISNSPTSFKLNCKLVSIGLGMPRNSLSDAMSLGENESSNVVLDNPEPEISGIVELIESKGGWLNRKMFRSSRFNELEQNKPVRIYLNNQYGKYDSMAKRHSIVKVKFRRNEKSIFSCKNVVGLVHGLDSSSNKHFLVISAHYDHLGVGPSVNGDSIYNGANDNAVGVVALLSAIKYFSKFPIAQSIIFLATSGEEEGLFGSAHFISNCPVDNSRLLLNVNLDGVGCWNDKIITIIGDQDFKYFSSIQEGTRDYGLTALRPKSIQRYASSADSYSFSQHGVPAITFSPGIIEFDKTVITMYHSPQDDVSAVNIPYMQLYSKSLIRCIEVLSKQFSRENQFSTAH